MVLELLLLDPVRHYCIHHVEMGKMRTPSPTVLISIYTSQHTRPSDLELVVLCPLVMLRTPSTDAPSGDESMHGVALGERVAALRERKYTLEGQ